MKIFGKNSRPNHTPANAPEVVVVEPPRRFFFVSGHPRSGTNWVSSLLNLHPDAFCDGEFHFLILRWAMDGYTSLPWYLGAQEPYKSIAERNFHQLIRESLIQRAKDRRNGHVPTALGDHTPRLFRVMITPPEARYIIVQRDGRDVLVSYTHHLLNTGAPDVIPESIRPFFIKQLERSKRSAADQHDAAAALLTYEPWVRYYAAFWSEHIWHDKRIFGSVAAQGFAPFVKFVKYETVRADVERGRTDLYDFLGLDPAKAAPVSPETNTAPGFGGRLDVKSFYRKGESGDWHNHFTADTARWFKEAAGPALIELGYEPDHAWADRITTSPGTRLADIPAAMSFPTDSPHPTVRSSAQVPAKTT